MSGGTGALLAALAPLVTTPIMLAYLGDYRYGLWMMLTSVAAVVALSDFGITNGITTELSQTATVAKERRRLISNAYVILAAAGVGLACLLALFFVGVRLVSSSEAERSFAAMLVAVLLPIALGVPLGFVLRLLYIDLRGFEASIAPGVAAFLSVAIAFLGIGAGLDPALLVFCFLATVPTVYLGLTLRYFYRNKSLVPTSADWDPATARRILRSGRMFVVLSLLVILCNRLDYIIVARVVGVVDLVPYSIADRLIGIANAAVVVLGASLWPVFARKIHEGEVAWVWSSILKINLVTLAAYAAFTVLLVLFYNMIVEAWLGTAKDASPAVLVSLALTSMVIALASPYFAVANSVGAIKEQMLGYLALLAVGLPLKSVAGAMFGPAGVAAGAFLSWALVMLPTIVFTVWRRLRVASVSGRPL